MLQNQTNGWHQGSSCVLNSPWCQLPPKISSYNFCMRERLEDCHRNLHELHWETWGCDMGWVMVLPDLKVTGNDGGKGGDLPLRSGEETWAKSVWHLRHVSRVNNMEPVIIPPPLSAESLICVFALTGKSVWVMKLKHLRVGCCSLCVWCLFTGDVLQGSDNVGVFPSIEQLGKISPTLRPSHFCIGERDRNGAWSQLSLPTSDHQKGIWFGSRCRFLCTLIPWGCHRALHPGELPGPLQSLFTNLLIKRIQSKGS